MSKAGTSFEEWLNVDRLESSEDYRRLNTGSFPVQASAGKMWTGQWIKDKFRSVLTGKTVLLETGRLKN